MVFHFTISEYWFNIQIIIIFECWYNMGIVGYKLYEHQLNMDITI